MTSEPRPASRAAQITLLTQADCSLCDQAKTVLARLVNEGVVTVREVDLTDQEGRDLAIRHGVLFAPGVLLDGRPFSYGRLSERKLRRQLALAAAADRAPVDPTTPTVSGSAQPPAAPPRMGPHS